jgi:hypothetical protein
VTEPLLLDQFLPTWDHEISVSRVFRAPPAEVFDAITNLDLFRLPVARVLLEARGLPGRLADSAARRHGDTVAPEPPTFRVRDLPARGWILLGERPGSELVYGAVGQPWKGTGGTPPEPPVTAETFATLTDGRDLRDLHRARVRQDRGEHRGHPVRRRGMRADDGEPGGGDRRGQPAPVPPVLASGRAVHPADAADRDACPGAAVAARRRPQAGDVTAGGPADIHGSPEASVRWDGAYPIPCGTAAAGCPVWVEQPLASIRTRPLSSSGGMLPGR